MFADEGPAAVPESSNASTGKWQGQVSAASTPHV